MSGKAGNQMDWSVTNAFKSFKGTGINEILLLILLFMRKLYGNADNVVFHLFYIEAQFRV